jgi:molybdopterin-guanine dinucleotide biosynthesis protein A
MASSVLYLAMVQKRASTELEICILAGGLSTRMGRNKTTLRLSGKSLLARVRAVAKETEFPFRVIRRDVVKRCGPLGGIVTVCRTSKAKSILFLACDMPFISQRLLRDLTRSSGSTRAVFAMQGNRAGFPFIIPIIQLPRVEEQMKRGEFSLQRLASALNARRVRVGLRSHELFNVNTPEDFVVAEQLLRKRNSLAKAAKESK